MTTAAGALDSNESLAGTETIARAHAFDAAAVAASLPLERKVELLTGATTWALAPFPRSGFAR